MSPIFQPDFTTVSASFPIWEKARYRVKVTKKVPFVREAKDDETGKVTIQCGVRYHLEMAGVYDSQGELQETQDGSSIVGKPVSNYACYVHTADGWQFAKPFLMAASGYNVKNEEDLANKELFAANEWGITGEPGDDAEKIEAGKGWDKPVGRYVDVTLSKKVTKSKKDGKEYENQDYSGWTPLGDRE